MVTVDALDLQSRSAALAYLDRAPYANVFLAHVITNVNPPPGWVIAARNGRGIRGVAYLGPQIVIAAEPDAIDPLAERAIQHRGTRMIVGPRDQVRAFWSRVSQNSPPPRIIRDRQLVMKVDPSTLRGEDYRVEVRAAHLHEAAEVARYSADMIRGELGYDPMQQRHDFEEGVAQMIERGLWYVGKFDGAICFVCNVGAWSTRTAQLQGIYVPPAMRRQGLATSALAQLCRKLFARVPTLSLYVNDFNAEAIALYERTGFETVGEFASLLF